MWGSKFQKLISSWERIDEERRKIESINFPQKEDSPSNGRSTYSRNYSQEKNSKNGGSFQKSNRLADH